MDVKTLKETLKEYGLTPNKALGQNFLADEAAANAIAQAACKTGLPVIEIGPGLGALTQKLLLCAPRVLAVEIDARMADILEHRLGCEKLEVIRADFLKTDVASLAQNLGGSAAVAGNLPYYITTPICMRLMRASDSLPAMTLMMQKEAAQRFTAQPHDRVYGPLSVMAQYNYAIESEMELTPASYYPAPEVDSVVLSLKKRGCAPHPELYALLECAFAMRRKTLANNLKAAGFSAERLETLFKSCGLPANVRAEALEVSQFADIAGEIEARGK